MIKILHRTDSTTTTTKACEMRPTLAVRKRFWMPIAISAFESRMDIKHLDLPYKTKTDKLGYKKLGYLLAT